MSTLKTFSKILATASIALMVSVTAMAADSIKKGVVVSKNETYQTITVRADDTGMRETFFLNDGTKLKSRKEGAIKFEDLKRGQSVNLVFSDGDTGRDVQDLTIAYLLERLDIVPVQTEEMYELNGVVKGKRPEMRTVTILPENAKRRITLNIPEGVNISRNGKDVGIRSLKIGDEATFKYRETDYGYVLVGRGDTEAAPATARTATPVVDQSYLEDDQEFVAELPATASNNIAWLMASISLMLTGFGLSAKRRSNAS